ncbi:MAG TPA: NrfD/PsrC family molybdoenzyme membrane anchor subunit [Planctomycetota bacterium]|nr:NrfD/PsrC family molybdoenzyme membrane anchor subunit [Planctomycetota bacterium]
MTQPFRPDPRASASTSTDLEREERLERIRREAEVAGTVAEPGVLPTHAPLPPDRSPKTYYDLPLLKAPRWTWEIPTYFFVGGTAGASAVIAQAAAFAGEDPSLVRSARTIAAAGALVSPALLVRDLGRPRRFLHMLRVFKRRSPMSVGAWTLTAFGGSATAAAVAGRLASRRAHRGAWRAIENASGTAAALSGSILATYTGVLLGATAIPAWAANARRLPLEFGTSGLGSAVAALELSGHTRNRPLRALGLLSSALATILGLVFSRRKRSEAGLSSHQNAMRRTRLAGKLSGPVSLGLRLLSLGSRNPRQLRRTAALAFLGGSLLERFAWISAGRESTRDARACLGFPPETSQGQRRGTRRHPRETRRRSS